MNYFIKATHLIIILTFFICGMSAQDIIIMKNGQEVEVIVKEVGLNSIKYVKFDNPSGPIYVEKKTDIFMIKYANGTKDVFGVQPIEENASTPHFENDLKNQLLSFKRGFFAMKYFRGSDKINKAQFIDWLKQDPEAYNYYSSYGTLKTFDRLFNGTSWIFAIFAVKYSYDGNKTPTIISAVGGLVSGVISGAFGRRAKSKLEMAVITYNTHLKNR